MEISSKAFNHNENIPAKYTCDGEGINPPLTIIGTPQDAKSLALIVDDPDAPSGTWVHWTVFNIDQSTQEIPENSIPQGATEGLTSSNSQEYGGPCPPSGTHRYFFKIYALDTTIDLDETAKPYDIEQAMEGHILDQAEFIGLYSRE
ncbi:MAG: YbhB/YbcL family Raf kinase inhibitor-like protein [Nitrospirota bacterium]